MTASIYALNKAWSSDEDRQYQLGGDIPAWLEDFAEDTDAYKVLTQEIYRGTDVFRELNDEFNSQKIEGKTFKKYVDIVRLCGLVGFQLTAVLLVAIYYHGWFGNEPAWDPVYTQGQYQLGVRLFAALLMIQFLGPENERTGKLMQIAISRPYFGNNAIPNICAWMVAFISAVATLATAYLGMVLIIHSSDVNDVFQNFIALSFIIEIDNLMFGVDIKLDTSWLKGIPERPFKEDKCIHGLNCLTCLWSLVKSIFGMYMLFYYIPFYAEQ